MTNATKDYYYRSLRKQQDIANHIIDEVNKLGVQIQKKIFDNVRDTNLINHVLDIVAVNIKEGSDNLLTKMGITKSTNLDGTTKYEVDKKKLSEIMINHHISNGSDFNGLYGSTLDNDGEFKLPFRFAY